MKMMAISTNPPAKLNSLIFQRDIHISSRDADSFGFGSGWAKQPHYEELPLHYGCMEILQFCFLHVDDCNPEAGGLLS